MDDGIRLYMFDCGTLEVLLRNFKLGHGAAGETITTPVVWFLLTHPRGHSIIDGGNAAECAVDAKARWGKITENSTLTMKPEQAVVPTLERLGIDLADVRWIIQTHLHLDHTGAIAAIDRFPNAQVLVTRTEHQWAHAPDSLAEVGYCKADYAKPGVPWALLEETDDGYDVYGDGVLRCWRTPGHSPGHQSLEIHLPSGASFFLTGDAANSLDHLDEVTLPGFIISAPDSLASVQKIKRLAWRADATIIAGHDPDQWATLKHAPDYYA